MLQWPGEGTKVRAAGSALALKCSAMALKTQREPQQFLHQRFTQIQTGETISQYLWEALSLGLVLPARSPTTGGKGSER